MFLWDQQRVTLNVPAKRVLLLERSLSDIEVTLPGLTPEKSRAYLCAFQAQRGIRIAVVLQLLKSNRYAYYLNQGGELESEDAGRMLDEGRQFAESLGFMLGEMDFRQLSPEDKQDVWKQLPFLHGQLAVNPPAAEMKRDMLKPPTAAPTVTPAPAPRRMPSPEEMMQRRRQFIENLGRLLAML